MKKKSKALSSDKVGLENYKSPDAFGSWLGYEIVKVDRKKHEGELKLTVRQDHLSPANRIHGGVISACFDAALALSVFSGMGPWDLCSTVELKVNYFRPIHEGDVLSFKSKAAFKGKRLWSVTGFAYVNGERDPAAMASGTWNVVKTALPPET